VFQDRTLTCRDCGREFAFTASEQQFFSEREFTNDPSRCPECRSARKQNRGNGRGPRSSQREMYPADTNNLRLAGYQRVLSFRGHAFPTEG
jgi:DNA-directed RNA polymerase subunit RPC12/RpoP